MLARARCREGVAARSQSPNEKLGVLDLARQWVDPGNPIAREVHEDLLARPVFLAHPDLERPRPPPVEIAELAVLLPVGVLFLYSSHRSASVTCLRRSSVWIAAQSGSGLVYLLRERPGDPGHLGATKVAPRCRLADPDALRDLPNRAPLRSQAQNFSNPPHGQPFWWHGRLLSGVQASRSRASCPSMSCRPPGPVPGAFAFLRNPRSESSGIRVRNPPESVFGLDRNRRSASPGIRVRDAPDPAAARQTAPPLPQSPEKWHLAEDRLVRASGIALDDSSGPGNRCSRSRSLPRA